MKRESSSWGYNLFTLFLRDINREGHETVNYGYESYVVLTEK
jgi:hypothetical protein